MIFMDMVLKRYLNQALGYPMIWEDILDLMIQYNLVVEMDVSDENASESDLELID